MESTQLSHTLKLKGSENWPVWRFQTEVLLKSRGVFNIATGVEACPSTEKESATWTSKDAKAQEILVTRMEEEPITHLFSCSTSSEMWAKLKSVYDRESTVSVHLLQQKFFTLTIENGESMSKYFSRIEEIKTKLKLADEAPSEKMIMTKILMSLPEPYKHFRSAWESVPADNQTLSEMTSRLLIEEERLSSSEEVVALAASRNNQTVKCFNCGAFGHFAKNCKKRDNRECYVCHKRGHISSNCKSKKKTQSVSSNKREENAFMSNVHGYEDINPDKDVWYLDSGASEHMCGEKELFENLIEKQCQSRVKVGDGNLLDVRGVGTVVVYAWDNQEYRKTTLSDVLFVPELKFNLLSAGHVLDKGFHLVSDNKQCQFVDKNGEVRAVANRVNKLYVMDFVRNGTLKRLANVASEKVFERSGTDVDICISNCHLGDKIEKLSEWHVKLSHQNFQQIKTFLRQRNITFDDDSEEFMCDHCLSGKQKRFPFTKSESRAKECLEILHADLAGPMETKSLGGNRFVLVIKDDYSAFRSVYFLKVKSASELRRCFEKHIAKAERETGKRVKIIRTDNGKEFVNSEMREMFEKRGITHQKSCTYSPQQNGRAEREIRTLVEAARAMIHGMEKKFWAEAMSTAAYTLNRSGPCPTSDRTPYEVYYNKEGCDVNLFKEFGSRVSIHIPKEKRLKWDPKSTSGYFLGYGEDVKGYRVYVPQTKRVETHRDIIFLPKPKLTRSENEKENTNIEEYPQSEEQHQEENIQREESPEENLHLDEHPESIDESYERDITLTELETSDESFRSAQDGDDSQFVEIGAGEPNYELRARETIKPPQRYGFVTEASFFCEEELNYNQVVKSKEREHWKEAMERELRALVENETWETVKRPESCQTIDCKWVFRRKEKSYKARLVARGFMQFDLTDVYSPVARLPSIRVFLAFCNESNLPIHQLDVCSAFLNGPISGDVYITLPDGCERIKIKSDECLKLKKSLYGLKESPKNWNNKFCEVMEKLGFKQFQSEYCLFVKIDENKCKTYILLYVDDLLLCSTDPKNVKVTKDMLSQNFKMKDLGQVNTFLGIDIKQNVENNEIILSQKAYLEKLLQKCNMSECNSVSVPIPENFDHSSLKRECSESREIEKRCRMIIGTLFFAMLCTRPDLCLSLNILSRYQSCASKELWNAIKHVLRYIKGTLELTLVFKKQTCNVNEQIVGYVDSDWAGDKVDRKSTGGFIFKVFNCSVIWGSKKQITVALSSTESEFVSLCVATSEACWLRSLYKELVGSEVNVTIYEDNQGVIKLCKNPQFSHKLKHVDIKINFIREKLKLNFVKLVYIRSEHQIADVFTKPLGRIKFKKFIEKLGLDA